MRPGPRRAALFGLVAVVALLVLVRAPHALAGTVSNGKIAFDNGAGAISVVDPDGSGLTQLTANGDSYPRWSPDGSKITFESNRTGSSQIYVMDADGGHVAQVTASSSGAFDPSFSADGSSILYDEGGAIMEIPANASAGDPASTQVLPNAGSGDYMYATDPVESPDGTQLALAGTDGNIWLYTYAGNVLAELTFDSVTTFTDYNEAWSADGSRIYFRHYTGSSWFLEWVSPTGGPVTALPVGVYDPAPSPDGTRLAYSNGTGIGISDPDGNGASSLDLPNNVSYFDLAWQSGPETFTVNTTADHDDGSCDPSPGDCTLREAIAAANAHPGRDMIAFALPGGGQQTIILDPQLSTLSVTGQVTIDGTTEPGIAPSSIGVTIDGGFSGGSGSSPVVLAAGSDGSAVTGLAFVDFASGGFATALELDSSGNVVAGNYFGVAADAGATSFTQTGILITGDGNTVGGTDPGDRNVFVSQTGVYVGDPYGASVTPSGNDILGNAFGLLPDGSTNPGISYQGVYLTDGAHDNVVGASLVGGQPMGAGNTFAGLTIQGVAVFRAGAGNTVGGNTVGLDSEGAPVLPGMQTGIAVTGTTGTIVGENAGPSDLYGLHPELGNVIAGTESEAIFIGDDAASSTGTIVAGNFIGVDRGGAATSPNATGIHVTDSSGNQLGPGNTVAHSTGDGIALQNLESAPTGNRIVANSIYANDGSGISLGDGGNNGLPAPTVTSASTTSASGMATGPAGSTLFIEVFGNPSCDGAANGAGQTFLTYATVTLPTGQGDTTAAWTAGFGSLPAGAGVTATATNSATNDTSTFSACATVAAAGSGGSLSGSVAQPVDDHIDLTAAGTDDWAVWGYDPVPSRSSPTSTRRTVSGSAPSARRTSTTGRRGTSASFRIRSSRSASTGPTDRRRARPQGRAQASPRRSPARASRSRCRPTPRPEC